MDDATPQDRPPVALDPPTAAQLRAFRQRASTLLWLGGLVGGPVILVLLVALTADTGSGSGGEVVLGVALPLSGAAVVSGLARLDQARKMHHVLGGFPWRRWSARFSQVGRAQPKLLLWPEGTVEPGTANAPVGAGVVTRVHVLWDSLGPSRLQVAPVVEVAGDPSIYAVVRVPGSPVLTLVSGTDRL